MTPRRNFLLATLALLATVVSLALVCLPSGAASPAQRASWTLPDPLVEVAKVAKEAVEDLTDFDPWLTVVATVSDPHSHDVCVVSQAVVYRRLSSGLVHLRGPPA